MRTKQAHDCSVCSCNVLVVPRSWMPTWHRLNKLTRCANDFISNRRIVFFAFVKVHVLSWALIPSNVHTVNRSHAPRKANGGIAINQKPKLLFIPSILMNEFYLDARHFWNPIKNEATVDLFTEVFLFTYLKLGASSSKHKQASKNLKLQISDQPMACIHLFSMPRWSPPLFCHWK